MNTKAMPVLLGSARSSCVNASKPPADAPTATIAKESVLPLVPALSCMSVVLRLDEERRVRRLPLWSRVRGSFGFSIAGGGRFFRVNHHRSPSAAHFAYTTKGVEIMSSKAGRLDSRDTPDAPPQIECLILLASNGEFGAA